MENEIFFIEMHRKKTHLFQDDYRKKNQTRLINE